MKPRPHLVDMFFRGVPVTGRMSHAVVSYIQDLEAEIKDLKHPDLRLLKFTEIEKDDA